MSLPLDVIARLDLDAKPRIHAHYEPPTYVCKACRMADIYWEAKGQPPCSCPPVWQNMPPGADGPLPDDELALAEWLESVGL